MPARRRSMRDDLFRLFQTGETTDQLQHSLGDQKLGRLRELVDSERAENPPRVAVIGKAGVGKTSTINSVFNADFRVSHSVFGTAAAQRKEYALAGGGTLHIIDMPGLGQSRASEKEYAEIYRRELPGVDVAVYVLQADERLLGEDQRILRDVVLPALAPARRGMPIVLGLNKVDLIGPGSWDAELNYPSEEQLTSIRRKSADIAHKLAGLLPGVSAGQIVHYSAERRFRLPDLLLAIIRAAGPAAWKLPANPASPWELASDEVQEYIRSHHGV